MTTTRVRGVVGLRTRGSVAQQQIAQYKMKAITRYKLHGVKGRPEELEQTPTTSPSGWVPAARGISIGYGCQQIRVRLMEGREWVAVADFQVGQPNLQRLFAILDPHFDFTPTKETTK